jgi:XTP/dITP diphosphohydrolase
VRIALASTNPGKLRELRALFPEWDIEPLAADYPDETVETFYENALAKVRFAREVVGGEMSVLGEDSGLEVDALDGRPGVRSARFAGPHATDEENVEVLLRELEGIAGRARGARYVSELVLLSFYNGEHRGTGTLEGRIAEEPRGSEGFGYDPVFIPAADDQTVAELGDAWKRENSHRAQAAKALRERLGKLPDGV